MAKRGRKPSKKFEPIHMNDLLDGFMTVKAYADKNNIRTQSVYRRVEEKTIEVLKLNNVILVK